jgi:6-phosphogluconolactonase
MRFFLGGYSADLNVAWLDEADGSLQIIEKVRTPENASFLHYVPELSALYATVEAGYRTGESGKIAAYRVDQAGMLTAIGSAVSCGAGPCHVDVDPGRGLLAAANYGGENFTVVRLTSSGSFGEPVACIAHEGSSVNASRQAEPHPHATYFSPGRSYLFVCDLGTDTVMRYPVDDVVAGRGREAGQVAASLAPGSGPRHLAFSGDASNAYVVNELSNTVTVFDYDEATGSLEQVQEISTLPAQFDAESTAAEIQVHPNDRFVYASNRGHDSIAVFRRDESNGTLEAAGRFATTGSGPRHFQIDPSGRWCLAANQFTDHVVSFRIDPDNGTGVWTGQSVHVVQPACVAFWR